MVMGEEKRLEDRIERMHTTTRQCMAAITYISAQAMKLRSPVARRRSVFVPENLKLLQKPFLGLLALKDIIPNFNHRLFGTSCPKLNHSDGVH